MLEHWSRIFFLVQRFLFAVTPVAYNTLFVISTASFEAHVLHSLRVCLRFVDLCLSVRPSGPIGPFSFRESLAPLIGGRLSLQSASLSVMRACGSERRVEDVGCLILPT
jgi:hypothetical protein